MRNPALERDEDFRADCRSAMLPDEPGETEEPSTPDYDEVICVRCRKLFDKDDCEPARDVGMGNHGYACWACAAGIQ